MQNLVVDIETIPQDFAALPRDLQAYVWQRAISRELGQPPELDAFLADPAAPEHSATRTLLETWMVFRPEFGHVVCVAWGVEPPTLEVHTLAARTADQERDLLQQFWQAIAALRGPRCWVTYNGLDFDLPYLLRRSALLGIEVPVPVPLRRYALSEHYDVMQALANWKAAERLPLRIAARLFGLAKADGLDGAGVSTAWRAGQVEAIAAYCAQDARVTYELFRRLQASGLR
jgi:hypothetical protein